MGLNYPILFFLHFHIHAAKHVLRLASSLVKIYPWNWGDFQAPLRFFDCLTNWLYFLFDFFEVMKGAKNLSSRVLRATILFATFASILLSPTFVDFHLTFAFEGTLVTACLVYYENSRGHFFHIKSFGSFICLGALVEHSFIDVFFKLSLFFQILHFFYISWNILVGACDVWTFFRSLAWT